MAKTTETKPEEINLADIEKQVDAIIKKAKEEADRIVAEAKAATADNGLSDEEINAKAERDAYWNELVEIKLFKDNNKYKDDVFVSVNGENCVIKRGVRVKVKRKFANVLDLSDLQDYETSILIENKSKEYSNSENN